MEELVLYEEILRLKREGIPAVLAVVVESSGSAPRKAGAKMLVKGDGSILAQFIAIRRNHAVQGVGDRSSRGALPTDGAAQTAPPLW